MSSVFYFERGKVTLKCVIQTDAAFPTPTRVGVAVDPTLFLAGSVILKAMVIIFRVTTNIYMDFWTRIQQFSSRIHSVASRLMECIVYYTVKIRAQFEVVSLMERLTVFVDVSACLIRLGIPVLLFNEYDVVSNRLRNQAQEFQDPGIQKPFL